MARWQNPSERQPQSHHGRDPRFIAPPAHRLHRYLSGALAGPAGAYGGNRRRDAGTVRAGNDTRHWRQQFFGGGDNVNTTSGACEGAAGAVEPDRTRHREGTTALLPGERYCDLRLRSTVPRIAEWPHASRQYLR